MILPHFVIQLLCYLINFQKIFHPIAPLRLLSETTKSAREAARQQRRRNLNLSKKDEQQQMKTVRNYYFYIEKERIFKRRPKVKVGLFLNFVRQIF